MRFNTYKVPNRTFQLVVEHDDLQGDVYWLFCVIFFSRGLSVQFDTNTRGKYLLPKFNWRLLK